MSGISILIPAHNEARTIRRTLQSIADQSSVDLMREVIVCDNGSSDGTAEQVAQMAELDPRIRLIEEPRAGKTHAWNRLFRLAHFDTAVFMDADVILAPGVIPRLCAGAGGGTGSGFGRRQVGRVPQDVAALAPPGGRHYTT